MIAADCYERVHPADAEEIMQTFAVLDRTDTVRAAFLLPAALAEDVERTSAAECGLVARWG
jgi:hypothetical protein